MEPTLTFVTTDKNPAVVFPTSLPPDYGGPPDPMENVHSAPLPNQAEPPGVPSYGNEATTDQNVRSTAVTTATTPPITVTVKPSVVVIDDHTFTDNPAQPTSKVVVDGNTFTINPTQVVGVGATITRPPNSGKTIPPPTKTTIGGIGVAIEGSSVVIDNTSFTIGPKPTTVVIEGQTITLKPGVIVFPSQTLTIPVAQETTQVVVGAELITAVGSDKAIIEGRTITYGPGSSTITEVIDEDTVLVGPSGIIVHDETYGGNKAKSTDVQFVVAGGVTISRIGSTVVVVQGVTYTLEPLASGYTYKKTTTVLGGETITIGPEGVAIETWTLNPPYVSITTITPSHGAVMALPTATAVAVNTSKESNGPSLASRQPPWALPACIATITSILGVWILQ
ncbi:hypothetical protein EKO27_g6705 [Xylaria grammica]|uniref:Uncharacterized protein n=1 Tax=Xylaria grammica TaxID=363999 RepID=A0A439D1S1_9PEZI|nr:hypothetical protein EKO27_g6705 [Xylaria grammica]